MRSTVVTKRGSVGSMKPTSPISKTLASSAVPPKLSTKALRSFDQARSRIVARSAFAGGPAHQAGRRVNARPRTQLPDAGVRLVVEVEGALADDLELGEIRWPGLHEQTRVEERGRRRQNEVAVG